ncbi:MAG: hypothetical protein LBG28_09475 [Tannerella sp.]|jgi:predicted glycosyltransferase involved in capsule biosynthesis|nr:hypothetical protein [Tannerella sp.]
MKYDLTDTTFLIIIRLDTIERLENMQASISCLLKHFDTNIKVWESSCRYNGLLKKLLDKRVDYTFVQDDDPILFRTMYINRMTEEVKTHYVSIWDADVIAPYQQVLDSVNILRNGKVDFVYPYETLFLDTTSVIRNLFLNNRNNLKILMRNQKRMSVMYPPNPVGGAFFCNVESYRKSGLENEDFYGWGVEDGERFVRWQKRGFEIRRVKGPLFHLSHPRGINSLLQHPDQSLIKTKLLNLINNEIDNCPYSPNF